MNLWILGDAQNYGQASTLGLSGQRRYEQVPPDAILRQAKCAEADDARTTFGNNCHYDLFINSLH